MQVTQADVARLAGVSQRTVSNVVNNAPHVRVSVIQRVNAAIRELGYTPSLAARTLRSGRSGVIQLVVPELDVSYFAELARLVVEKAEERGFVVVVRQTLGDGEREREALTGESARHADGTILSSLQPVTDLQDPRRIHPPTVLIGENKGMGVLDHIGIDDEEAAYAATAHLLSVGYRRIALIGTDPGGALAMAQMRRRGYERALGEADLEVDPSLVVATQSYHRRDGELALDKLMGLPDPPNGVFCVTDMLALGVLRRAHDTGISVPTDLSVVGMDGVEEARYSVPSLSTIAPDKGQLAESALDALIGRIAEHSAQGEARPGKDLVVPFRLIQRESTSR